MKHVSKSFLILNSQYFDKEKFSLIHSRNLPTIATEMFKVTRGFVPVIFSSVLQ